MFASHSGLIVRCQRGAVVIMAPLSSTAFASSGDVWTSCTIVWARASRFGAGSGLLSSGSWSGVGGLEGGCCLMLGGGWRWVRTWRGFGAVLRVDEPVVVAVCGFSEGIVVARDMIVEPSSVRFPWGHVVSAGAVVGIVRVVGSSLLVAAAIAVSRIL